MSRTHQRGLSETTSAPEAPEAVRRAYARLWRNFWGQVTAAVVAAGVLSAALRMPPGAAAGTLTGLSGIAAVAAVALAGRILVAVSRAVSEGRRHHRSQTPPRRR